VTWGGGIAATTILKELPEVPLSLARSHISYLEASSREACTAAELAASIKVVKYAWISPREYSITGSRPHRQNPLPLCVLTLFLSQLEQCPAVCLKGVASGLVIVRVRELLYGTCRRNSRLPVTENKSDQIIFYLWMTNAHETVVLKHGNQYSVVGIKQLTQGRRRWHKTAWQWPRTI